MKKYGIVKVKKLLYFFRVGRWDALSFPTLPPELEYSSFQFYQYRDFKFHLTLYTLRILVFRVVGFLARLSHVCPIHSSNSTRCRLAD